MVTLMFAVRLDTIYHGRVLRRLRMSLEHVDGWIYRLQTVVGNVTHQSFVGLPSRRNLTLISRVKLKSLSYALPR